jgi:hypothetical protein
VKLSGLQENGRRAERLEGGFRSIRKRLNYETNFMLGSNLTGCSLQSAMCTPADGTGQ